MRWPWFMLGLGVGILMQAFYHIEEPADDTDGQDGQRSGMSLHRDAMTGCEYLSRRGGLTPRLDTDGKQVCR